MPVIQQEFDTSIPIASTSAPTTSDQANTILQNVSYTHVQSVASNVWNVAHMLGYFPSVNVVDSGGTTVIGNIQFIDGNSLTLTFVGAFTGKAYLS